MSYDIHKELARIFQLSSEQQETLRKPPRFARQKAIEDAIMDFAPDFVETQEIASALMASLERRKEQDMTDILEAYYEFKDALLEADATEEREHDDYNNRLRNLSRDADEQA